MKMERNLTAVLVMSLLLISCAPLQKTRNAAQVMELKHIRGNDVSCLANCVDMVLDYYGYAVYFARQPEMNSPANLLAMDSLIHAMSPASADPYRLQSFILQGDQSFLDEQLARRRPVIVIVTNGRNVYHSLVVSGFTADHKSYYVHDPARDEGHWIRRGRLLKLWSTTHNTALLVGITPAGT